jgi:prepilin signal peptidase PulO-like enzyme (type II secretory pathway)
MFTLSLFFFLLSYFGGMGMGDAKLAVGLGALFGWQLTLTLGFIAVLLGGIVAIVLLIVLKLLGKYRRGIPIPFGPYLAVAGMLCLFSGDDLLRWYLGMFGLSSAATLPPI